MAATLTLEVSEALLQRLQRESAQQGKRPEELAADYLAQVVLGKDQDPLLRWVGALASNVPDAAERHDHYLGEALSKELTGDRGP
jgi:hypothetical protein